LINRIIVYEACPSSVLYSVNQFNVRKATSLEDIQALIVSDDFRETAKERFQSCHTLYFISQDHREMKAWGWMANRVQHFYVYEIADMITFKEPVDVLYDFYTTEEFRNRGAYKTLLTEMVNKGTGGVRKVIYALSNNIPSRSAIERCGFRFCGTISHYTKGVL